MQKAFSGALSASGRKDVFNKDNQTFPQHERLLKNEYSINLPAIYNLKGKQRSSWINVINPMRGVLIMGSPGSGKSYFIIQHIIRQHIEKGFSMFIFDFKYDDLTKIAYNHFLKNRKKYKVEPQFYLINFDDLSRCHRCNPLHPDSMNDITDAVESARTILLGLNRSWIKKQGEFFIESPINFVTAIIWFLRKYRDGEFCTLPHVIELMQAEQDKLFTILRTEPEIEPFINPFISAYINGAAEQLEGQIASAKIAMARLASPILYYVMTGNDITLDINNPQAPKIVCLANNPQTGGDSIIHWDFSDEAEYLENTKEIIVKKFSSKSLVIVDSDFGKNPKRKSLLRGLLKERFVQLVKPEIENFLSVEVIKSVLLTYPTVQKNIGDSTLPEVNGALFNTKKIGYIIDNILFKDLHVKKFGNKKSSTATLKSGDKFIFCAKALEFISEKNLNKESIQLV